MRRQYGPIVFVVSLMILLWLIPTGFEGAMSYGNAERVKAEVLSTDESNVKDIGVVRTGEQRCVIRFLEGSFKGEKAVAVNYLSGSLAQDKIFTAGDRAFVVVNYFGMEISSVTMTDHFRLDKEAVLVIIFACFLILFAGKTGIRAILSFASTILVFWKVLIPCLLKGWNPVWLTFGLVILMTVVLLCLIYGFDRRCLAASLGAVSGIALAAVLGSVFTETLQIHGAVMESSENLLYAGYQHLNLTEIFKASIFLGASGAVVDLAVDISSAVYEVVQKKTDITAKEAICSGLAVGRAACSSNITTILFAYSGSFITILMVFMAQGTPVEMMLNYKYIAAEVVHTIVGAFGLIAVAPLTALTSGLLFVRWEL